MSTNNTYFNLADLKASSITEGTAFLVQDPSGVQNGMFFWELGDFSGQADEENVFESDDEPLSGGAWVRQSADAVSYRMELGAAVQPLASAVRVIRTVSSFALPGDNHTQTVQRAIDALVAHAAGGTLIIDGEYTVSGLTITDGVNIEIVGGTLALEANSQKMAVLLQPRGSCSNVRIHGVRMVGPADSSAAAQYYAIYNFSSSTPENAVNLDYLVVENCDITNFNAGICFNAASGGQIGQCAALGNRISNMLGIYGGQGYGLFTNAADGVIFSGNFIDRTERHAVYVAGSRSSVGAGVMVTNNQSRNHRLTVPAGVENGRGNMRPAFYYARTFGIVSSNNEVHDFYDGAFGVAQDVDANRDAGRVRLDGDQWFNRKNPVASLILGQFVPPEPIRRNTLDSVEVDVTGYVDEALAGRSEEVFIPNGLNISGSIKLPVANLSSASAYRPVVIGDLTESRGSPDLNNLDIAVSLYPKLASTADHDSDFIRVFRLLTDVCQRKNTSLGTGYQWTAAGSAFKLEISGGGIPGLPIPAEVYSGATRLARAAAGSLAEGQWGYQNDTIYVRLPGGADPDSMAMTADFPSQIFLSARVYGDIPYLVTDPQSTVENHRLIVKHGDAVHGFYTPGDTYPTVWGGVNRLLVNNSSATTITGFRDGYDGQMLLLTMSNANTSFAAGPRLSLLGSADFTTATARTSLLLHYSGVAARWIEVSRSINS